MAATTLSGGDKLAAKLRELAEKVSRPGTLRVGFLENATYPDGTSVALVAAVQEFGSPSTGVPPRPYFRTMIAAQSPGWGDAIGHLLQQNNYDAPAALNVMGQVIKAELQESITQVVAPPLSPVTLMLRKMRADNPDLVVNASTVVEARRRVAAGQSASGVSVKPLVDTGHLLNSVDYEVNA